MRFCSITRAEVRGIILGMKMAWNLDLRKLESKQILKQGLSG
ncbi:hypothetical protein LINGRAHAP2_LOCUS20500 [Linum grandiflorum]